MAVSKKLLNFLEKAKINYNIIEHKTVYTAYDKAQTLKVPEKLVGKTLVLKFDKNFALVLISANKILAKENFKKFLNNWLRKLGQKPIREIDFVNESWMKKNLKGVKVGAIPPFGNFWNLPTFIDKSIFKNPEIILSAGDYNSSIKIKTSFLKKLIPDLVIGNFGKIKK